MSDQRSYSAARMTLRAPRLCASAYPMVEQQSPAYQWGGVEEFAKGIQNIRFANGQKLNHVPACEDTHAEQEGPLHYTHYYHHHPSKAG